MARPLKKEAQNAASTPEPANSAGAVVSVDAQTIDSPARHLQQELERALSGAGELRWSARRSLAFIIVTNVALWIAVIWAIRTVLS